MILALESSCDETAVALFDPARGLTGEWVHSQIALHERHGGVVPDLATREHLRNFVPLLERAQATPEWARIDTVAVTHGPGLAACLAIGTAAAKALALAWRVPLVGVNHLRGHVWSPFLATHAAAPAEFDARLAKRSTRARSSLASAIPAGRSSSGSRRRAGPTRSTFPAASGRAANWISVFPV